MVGVPNVDGVISPSSHKRKTQGCIVEQIVVKATSWVFQE